MICSMLLLDNTYITQVVLDHPAEFCWDKIFLSLKL